MFRVVLWENSLYLDALWIACVRTRKRGVFVCELWLMESSKIYTIIMSLYFIVYTWSLYFFIFPSVEYLSNHIYKHLWNIYKTMENIRAGNASSPTRISGSTDFYQHRCVCFSSLYAGIEEHPLFFTSCYTIIYSWILLRLVLYYFCYFKK